MRQPQVLAFSVSTDDMLVGAFDAAAQALAGGGTAEIA